MSKQFVEGNKYVFVTKKCKKDLGLNHNGNWINQLNGHAVEITDSIEGKIKIRSCIYGVVSTWCKCIGRDVYV